MGNMVLWVDSFETTPLSLPCYHIDFPDLFSHSSLSGYNKHDSQQHTPTFEEPWLTHCFSCKASFAVDEVSHKVVDEGNLPASFIPKFQYQIAPSSQGYIQPKVGTYSVITDKPADWDSICLKRIAIRQRSNGVISLSRYTNWNSLVSYAGNTRDILLFNYPIAMTFLVHDGLRSFSFGISNCPNAALSVNYDRNMLCSGMVVPLTPMAGLEYQVGWAASNLTDEQKSVCFTDLFNNNYLIQEVTLASGNLPTQGQDVSVTRCQTYPCEYVIPKGTVFRGVTLSKDWQMYGVMSVSFNQYGEAVGVIVQALSYNLWSIRQGQSGNNAGPDTNSMGGHGKQQRGTDDPFKTITRNTNGGILTDPTSGAGFCIYKFTPAQFSDFLAKLYSETALPTIESFIGKNIHDPAALPVSGSWTNMDNLVFVKTSPVSFPSTSVNLRKMTIGVLGVTDIQCEIVTEYLTGNFSGQEIGVFGSDPQWFTDLEPYASASIYFPLAGAISIPPSLLEGAKGYVRYAFNLLNDGCGYSLKLVKEGSSLYYAKNGECCKAADCIIAGRDFTNTLNSVSALAATGISTLATGGTATPKLITTTIGAATTAVHDAVDMSVVNLPPSSSGSPYDDTVNGGLRDIFLYRPKAVRFNSGESGNDNERSKVMGTFSYRYLQSLDELQADSYFSVMDVKVNLSSGMTKAEHDEIVALLKEGVWK